MTKFEKFYYKKIVNRLYINEKDLKKISKKNHIIGLHSHSHPTKIANLSYNKQKDEFKTNKKILTKKSKQK